MYEISIYINEHEMAVMLQKQDSDLTGEITEDMIWFYESMGIQVKKKNGGIVLLRKEIDNSNQNVTIHRLMNLLRLMDLKFHIFQE